MTSKEHFLTDQYAIASDNADFMRKLRISSLVNFYIQSAWKHAEQFDVGYSHLAEMGLGWVLSRFTLQLEFLPDWPDTFVLTTWSKGMNRLFYLRDAELHTMDNIRFASISSAWLMIDKQSKRPKVYHPEWLSKYHHSNRHAIDAVIPTLDHEGDLAHTTKYITRYSDIDVNQHLTTIRYIDFVFDTYDLDFLHNHQPSELTVNFLKEIPHGKEIAMQRYEKGNIHYFELVYPSEQSVCFRAQVKYYDDIGD